MTSVVWGAVVGLLEMRRSIFSDKTVEVASSNQFFYFILKRLAFIGGVAIIFVIFAVLGHFSIGGFQGFAWWWDEIGLERFVKEV